LADDEPGKNDGTEPKYQDTYFSTPSPQDGGKVGMGGKQRALASVPLRHPHPSPGATASAQGRQALPPVTGGGK